MVLLEEGEIEGAQNAIVHVSRGYCGLLVSYGQNSVFF